MARAQFQGGQRAQGFNPVQVSQANISRMREESQRVVENMTMRADAELKNRKQILQDMKGNAAYYDKVRERDFNIQSQNIRTQQQASKDRAQQVKEQARVDAEATQQIYGTIAKLSKTASEKFAEIEQERFDEDWLSGVQEYMINPDPAGIVDQKVGQDKLAIDNEVYQSGIDQKVEAGGDPLLAAKARSMSPAMAQGYEYAKNNSILRDKFPAAIEAALNDNEKVYTIGEDTFTGVEARGNRARTAAVVATTQREFFIQNGLVGAKFESIAPGLAAAQRAGQSVISREGKVEELSINDNLGSTATNMMLNGNFKANALTSFRTWIRTTGSPTKAHAQYASIATAINPTTGEFLVSDEDWMGADVDGSGQPYSERFTARTLAIQQDRQQARQQWLVSQNRNDDLAYRADVDRILEGLTADPSAANAKSALEFFRTEYGKIPPEIQKFSDSYTTEAIADEEFLEQAQDLSNRGMLTQEFVDAATARGYDVGSKVQQLYGKQKETYGPEYDRAVKSLGQTAKDVVKIVPGKDATGAAVLLQTQMERDFQQRFQGYLAQGMGTADAANKAALEVQNEVTKSKYEEGSVYQVVTNPDGSVSLPGIERTLTPTTAGKERLNRVQSELRSLKGSALFKPNAIITDTEANKISEDYRAGRRIQIPPTAQYAATRLGINPLEVINAQLEAQGLPGIGSPALEAAGEISPAFQKLLFKTPSPERATRALGSTGTWNPAVLPQRAQQYVPMLENAASLTGLPPAQIAAMAEIESNWNPNIPSYNGSSFGLMQIHRNSHPEFFANNNWRDPQASLNYGAQYFAGLVKRYNGDLKAAAMAYNAGPGAYDEYAAGKRYNDHKEREMINHGRKYMETLYKYGSGQQALTSGQIQRPGSNIRQSTNFADPNFSPTGDAKQRTISVGRHLQSLGYGGIWQHPDFEYDKGYTGSGGERVMRRSYNSSHNHNEALDFGLQANGAAKLDKLYDYLSANQERFGIKTILWRVKGHHDHLHVDFDHEKTY